MVFIVVVPHNLCEKKGFRHGDVVIFQFLAESKMTNACVVNMMQPPQMRQLTLHKETAKLSEDCNRVKKLSCTRT